MKPERWQQIDERFHTDEGAASLKEARVGDESVRRQLGRMRVH